MNVWQMKDRFDAVMEAVLLPVLPQSVTPNLITGVRFVASALVVATVFFGWWVTSLLLVFVAGFTDWMDGWLARARGPMTEWGKRWDERADKLLVLGVVAALLARWYWYTESVGWLWYVLVAAWSLTVLRDIVMVWLRKLRLSKSVVLPVAKLKTALQLVALVPLLSGEWWWPLQLIGVAIFGYATALSLYSAWVYAAPARSQISMRWS
ncbi:MAG: CDP-alcohol phosphatidyltransferase family protein [Candidatus Kaiserbacteria bacterium]|nr:CDP-alcohol phosphatidyltransferase family protein [Candidatus Kaiserbacteria bacterium]MCB9816352.1 CDP-alcohol phosphatidyltransferase family protein [Candidatus Nomurabacteria bacterium]